MDAIESFESGNLKDAIDRFEIITKGYSDHPLAHLMLARCYIERKQYEKAIGSLYSHLKVVPNSVEAMVYLGLAYYECGELTLAQARFEEAMKLKQNSILASGEPGNHEDCCGAPGRSARRPGPYARRASVGSKCNRAYRADTWTYG